MNKTAGIILGLVAVLIIGGLVFTRQDKNDLKMEAKSGDTVMMKSETAPVSEGEMMKIEETATAKDESVMVKGDTMMAKAGTYESYDQSKIANAEKGKVVLFFRAGWCPTCKALDADIMANLDSIPADLTILDVNYDTATELKKKYGVTYQHTLVQVDAKGNLINKWSGSPTLSSLSSQIK